MCARGDLDAAWASASRDRLSALLDGTTRLVAARRQRDDAVARARRLLTPPPPFLARSPGLGLPDVGPAWVAWSAGAALEDALALATHLQAGLSALDQAVRALVDAARAEILRREDAWLPLAARIAAWLPRGRAAAVAALDLPSLKKAEKWLTTFEGDRGPGPPGPRGRAPTGLGAQGPRPRKGAPFSAQILCLGELFDDKALAAEVAWTWHALSAATHHHADPMPPGAADLAAWTATVERFLARVRGGSDGNPG